MSSLSDARSVADRVTWAATARGISINHLMSNAGVSKSVVDRMKAGNMPSADKIASIASALGIPTDFLMGSGVFENWDLILDHKTAVLSSISDLLGDISSEMRNGVDDLTLARLVSSFNVEIEMGNDPAGLEILVTSPVATFASSSAEKAPAPGLTENGREMLELFDQLPEREQLLLLGRLQEMVSPIQGDG